MGKSSTFMYDGLMSANSVHITHFSEAFHYETLLVNTNGEI
jgi:hypothetical protein